MSYPQRELRAIPECDNEETGENTCWSMEMDGGGKKHYIWITKYDEKEYIIEDSEGNNLTGDKIYKTLQGAKKKAEEIAYRQEDTGYFTN